ncbi:unnamed protein product, partial [Effrenium voratum]
YRLGRRRGDGQPHQRRCHSGTDRHCRQLHRDLRVHGLGGSVHLRHPHRDGEEQLHRPDGDQLRHRRLLRRGHHLRARQHLHAG